MQHRIREYDPERHDRWRVINETATGKFQYIAKGTQFTIRTKGIDRVAICRNWTNDSGDILAFAEVKEISHRKGRTTYEVTGLRSVVEYPVRPGKGYWWLVVDKGDIIEYPKRVILDKKTW